MKPLILSMLLLSSSVFADQITIENRSQNLIRVEYKLNHLVGDKYIAETPVLSNFLVANKITKIDVPPHEEWIQKIYTIERVMVYDQNGNFKFLKEFKPNDDYSGKNYTGTNCYADYFGNYEGHVGKINHGMSLNIYDQTQDVICSAFFIAE